MAPFMDPCTAPHSSDASSSASDPPSLEDRPLPPLPHHRKPVLRAPPTPSAPLPKSRAWRSMHRNAVRVLRQPRLLARLLHFTSWDDLYALFATCAGIRRLWGTRADIRDVILAHYLPSYRTALRQRDLAALQAVHVSLHDLHLLCPSVPALPVHADHLRSSARPARPAPPVSDACPRQPLPIPCPPLR
jgi:hypothetical protein